MIDELHSHLYLKSFWCESRWAAYVPNQQTCKSIPTYINLYSLMHAVVPKVEFEDEVEPIKANSTSQASPTSPSFRPSRLSRFLNDLALRPNDPPHDLNEPSFRNSDKGFSASSGMSTAASAPSLFSFASTSHSSAAHNAQSLLNPESDSFSYMETLLESLAVLGKLGNALDNVAQRLPNEIFTMVESTLDEVAERAEYGRRGSMFALNAVTPHGRSEGVYIFSSGDTSSGIGSAVAPKGGFLTPSCLRLAALESTAKRVDHEILKDLFWTIYSKLDAVAQGLRVVYEVANRIGSVSPALAFLYRRSSMRRAMNFTILSETRFQRLFWSKARCTFPPRRNVDACASRGQSI